MNILARCWAKLKQGREGACLLETALLTPVLLLMIVGAVDIGRGFTMAIELSSAAHAGAIYGTQNPTDTAGMAQAAVRDTPAVSGLSATATYGCECADGSSASALCTVTPVCADNYVYYVTVTASATYTPMLHYPFLPATLNLSSTSRLRAGGD